MICFAFSVVPFAAEMPAALCELACVSLLLLVSYAAGREDSGAGC